MLSTPATQGPCAGIFIEEILRPATLNAAPDEEGAYVADAVVRYGEAIFDAQFRILPTGMIEMLDDDILMTGLAKAPKPAWTGA